MVLVAIEATEHRVLLSPRYSPSFKMSSTIGIPTKLLQESLGHVITVELKTGQVYRGKLFEGEAWSMACWLSASSHTSH